LSSLEVQFRLTDPAGPDGSAWHREQNAIRGNPFFGFWTEVAAGQRDLSLRDV